MLVSDAVTLDTILFKQLLGRIPVNCFHFASPVTPYKLFANSLPDLQKIKTLSLNGLPCYKWNTLEPQGKLLWFLFFAVNYIVTKAYSYKEF